VTYAISDWPVDDAPLGIERRKAILSSLSTLYNKTWV
jgi:hypothetical protein